MSFRDLLSAVDVREWVRSGCRLTARGVSIALFVVLLGVSISVTAGSNPIVLAALATFVAFYFLKALLPARRIEAAATALATGEAGIWAVEAIESALRRTAAALRAVLPWGGR